jgi:hypothetical protein
MQETPEGKIKFEVRMPLKVFHPKKYTTHFTNYIAKDVTYINKYVVGFEYDDSKITGVITADKETHRFNKYVLAAGVGSV